LDTIGLIVITLHYNITVSSLVQSKLSMNYYKSGVMPKMHYTRDTWRFP